MSAPSGHGIYSRALPAETVERFDFACVSFRAAQAGELARGLRARGKRVFAFSDPAEWTPGRWRETIVEAAQFARSTRIDGVIADPENAWPGAADSQAEELGRALKELARSGLSVGLTSYPLMPRRAAFAKGCGGAVWGSPQLYAKDYGAAAYKRWHADWRSLFSACIPSLSLWDSGNETDAPDTYARYLDSIPPSLGWIGWPASNPPAWRRDMFLSKSPSGGFLGWLMLFFSDPFMVALVIAAVLGLAFMVL